MVHYGYRDSSGYHLVTAPSAPINFQVQTPSGGGAVIYWDAPLSDGGIPVESYVLSYRASGGQWSNRALSATSPNMAYTQLGLPTGVLHEFRVAAVNSVGQSPWSTTVTATPQALVTAPSAPINFQVQTPSGGGAVIYWDAPLSDGGIPVESYVLSYRASGGQWSNRALSATSPNMAYTQLGLPTGVLHEFRVAAVNSVGQSPWSTTVTATPQALVTAPSAPINFQVQMDVDGRGATLSWDPPVSDGGSPPIIYNSQVSTDGGNSWISAFPWTDSLTDRVAPLTNGTTYTFRVVAQNQGMLEKDSTWITITSNPLVGLQDSDATALTTLLQDFSSLRTGVWEDGSSHSANTILRKPYSANDWEAYFSNFFENNAFTKNLRDYIGYPVFLWFGSEMRELQEGLVTPLLDVVERSWNSAVAAGTRSFVDNATLTEELNGALIMLSNMSKDGWGIISPETQARIYTTLVELYSNHSSILRHGTTHDPVSMPWFATLRARTTLTVASAIPTTTANRLTASAVDKQKFAVDVGLTGSQLSLWQDHDLLYLDNKLSSELQYSVVDSFLTQIPKDLQNLMMISVNDFLGNTSALQGRSIGLSYLFGGVNTFSTEVGVASENSFPSGHTPHRSDLFGLALGHEISHNIDSFYIGNSTDLTSKRDGLIQSAGTNSQNYLRSMVGGAFFQNAPQEFFASIGNQWFSDTSLTFEVEVSQMYFASCIGTCSQ